MNKPLDEDAITRAMRESPNLAKNGTPEQKAGMFRPDQTKLGQTKIAPPSKKRRTARRAPRLDPAPYSSLKTLQA